MEPHRERSNVHRLVPRRDLPAARLSGAAADREQARRLAQGLLACASVSDVPGFIARGMGTDGKCHYPMGSQDQTHPWFYGLHAYATSGLPDAEERKIVVDKMNEVAERWKRRTGNAPVTCIQGTIPRRFQDVPASRGRYVSVHPPGHARRDR